MSGSFFFTGYSLYTRRAAVTILLCLPAALSAMAQGPAISHLTWTQQPNGTAGTVIDISYDLASPNGNCAVSAFLSKDNGATFPFPIATATGAIGAGVTPGTGKHILWDVAADYPGENIAQAVIRIVADDGVIPPPPQVTSFLLAGGAATTENLTVTLDNVSANGPTDYMASEASDFSGTAWQSYATAPSFTLSLGVGARTVYFKVKNSNGESGVVSDAIFIAPAMLPVAAGTFTMGNSGMGDDATYGVSSELPAHEVTLSAYTIATCMTTNKAFCDVLNWALAQGYLKTSTGTSWAGTGDVYGGGNLQILIEITLATRPECNIQYVDGAFISKTRTGLPGTTSYSMDTHPVVTVSWYGAVAFCNWLSEWQGLTPCYDMNTANWPLTVVPPAAGGYRLPTEAEWERAAAWDGSKHWIYGFTSDTLTGDDRCNYGLGAYPTGPFVNPLGITEIPYSSPVAWFDGVNVSPNGGVATVNSVSPVGAYDMSGNLWEWCHDWYSTTYYSGGAMTNPTGPATGANRVLRGGSFRDLAQTCRTAARDGKAPTVTPYWRSFRIGRTQ